MRHIDTVLFDLDDTLHDDTTGLRAAARSVADAVAAERGIDARALAGAFGACVARFWAAFAADHLTQDIGVERRRMWHEALREVGIDEQPLAARCAHDYATARAEALTLLPGALDVLVALRERGCKLGLVTNGLPTTHQYKIDRLGLRDRMDGFFLAGEVGMVKPDPAFFEHACRMLGSEPGRTAMVGDRYDRDVRGAQDVGLFTVLIDVHRSAIPAGGPAPDATVASIADVLAVIPLASAGGPGT